jgi:hypothetical protein
LITKLSGGYSDLEILLGSHYSCGTVADLHCVFPVSFDSLAYFDNKSITLIMEEPFFRVTGLGSASSTSIADVVRPINWGLTLRMKKENKRSQDMGVT